MQSYATMRETLTRPHLDINDVARLLKLDITSVRRLVQERKLPAYQIGGQAYGHLRFHPADVERVLNQWREIGAHQWETRGGR